MQPATQMLLALQSCPGGHDPRVPSGGLQPTPAWQSPLTQRWPLMHCGSLVHAPPPTQRPLTQVWPWKHWVLVVQTSPPWQVPLTQIWGVGHCTLVVQAGVG